MDTNLELNAKLSVVAQWLRHYTTDWKIMSSNPSRGSAGI